MVSQKVYVIYIYIHIHIYVYKRVGAGVNFSLFVIFVVEMSFGNIIIFPSKTAIFFEPIRGIFFSDSSSQQKLDDNIPKFQVAKLRHHVFFFAEIYIVFFQNQTF